MFSVEEVELLMQGLDSIERAASAGDMMGDMLVALVARGDKEQEEKLRREREERQRQKATAIRDQKMRISILKGKLAQIALEVKSEAPFGNVSTVG